MEHVKPNPKYRPKGEPMYHGKQTKNSKRANVHAMLLLLTTTESKFTQTYAQSVVCQHSPYRQLNQEYHRHSVTQLDTTEPLTIKTLKDSTKCCVHQMMLSKS